MTTTDSSINRWLHRLENGDGLAAERIWNIYFERLVQLAHRRLQARIRKVVDAEDVALSAFTSFCNGVKQGQYPQLADRDGLWRLLVSITIHKVLHAVRREGRQKRGGHFRELKGISTSSESIEVLNQLVSREPSPEFACEVAEQYDQFLKALGDPDLVQLAIWKMEGMTNEEIATRLNRTTRTVERKLQLIRKIWIRRYTES